MSPEEEPPKPKRPILEVEERSEDHDSRAEAFERLRDLLLFFFNGEMLWLGLRKKGGKAVQDLREDFRKLYESEPRFDTSLFTTIAWKKVGEVDEVHQDQVCHC